MTGALLHGATLHGPVSAGLSGGASLSEVVTPGVLLAPAALVARAEEQGDEALSPLRLLRAAPRWWRPDPPQPVGSAPQDVSGGGRGRGPKQRPLPGLAPPPEAVAGLEDGADEEARPALIEALARSAVFKVHTQSMAAREVEAALETIAHLARANDQLDTASFTARCGVPERHAGGLVQKAAEVLHRDGYEVIIHDRKGKQVRLERATLCQLYELEVS